jgi:hypothetical protein
LWPPQLVEKGTVDYLVYYATSIDDPEEQELVNASTLRRFRELIAWDDGGCRRHLALPGPFQITRHYGLEQASAKCSAGILRPGPCEKKR